MRAIQMAVACVVVVVIGGAGRVQAGVIFSQSLSATPSSTFGYNSNGPNSNSGNDQEVADGFEIGFSTTVAGVDWFGIYHDGSVPGSEDFLIRFFSDSSGLPGTLLFEETVSVVGIDTGFDNVSGFSIMEYSSTLSAPFAVASATPFHISILEDDPSTSSIWTWQFSDGTTGTSSRSATFTSGNWATDGGRDMAFTLNDGVVPEPSSLTLLAMGAIGFIGYGWRRKRKLAA